VAVLAYWSKADLRYQPPRWGVCARARMRPKSLYQGLAKITAVRQGRHRKAHAWFVRPRPHNFAANVLSIILDIQAASIRASTQSLHRSTARKFATGGQWRHVQLRQILGRRAVSGVPDGEARWTRIAWQAVDSRRYRRIRSRGLRCRLRSASGGGAKQKREVYS
jgi:hypothetical protein